MSLKFYVDKKNLLPFLLIITIYLIGVFSGVIINDIPGFTLKKEISIGDLLILALTYYIARILNKNLTVQRSEKDILIKACDKLQNDLLSLKEFIDSVKKARSASLTQDNARMIMLKTRHVSKTLSILTENLKQYKNNPKIKSTIADLEDNQKDYWKYITAGLTNTPPQLTKRNYTQAENVFYKYIGNITTLSLSLNNI